MTMDSFELSPDTYDPSLLNRQANSPYHTYSDEEEQSFEAEPAPADGYSRTSSAQQPSQQRYQHESQQYQSNSQTAAGMQQRMRRPIANQPQGQRVTQQPSAQRQATPRHASASSSVSASANQPRTAEASSESLWAGIAGTLRLFKGGSLVKFIGILLTVFAVYLLVSAISYFSNGAVDQSVILHNTIAEAAHEGEVGNAGGPLGAYLSHLMLSELLGIASFIMIYYIGAIGVTLVGWHRFKFWSLSFRCLMSTIALSVLLGFVTYGTTASFSLGGAHGYYANRLLLEYSGVWGAIGVNILLISAVVLIFFNELKVAYGAYRRRADAYREKLEKKRANIEARRRKAREELARSAAEQEAARRASERTVHQTVNMEVKDTPIEDSAVSDAALVNEVKQSVGVINSEMITPSSSPTTINGTTTVNGVSAMNGTSVMSDRTVMNEALMDGEESTMDERMSIMDEDVAVMNDEVVVNDEPMVDEGDVVVSDEEIPVSEGTTDADDGVKMTVNVPEIEQAEEMSSPETSHDPAPKAVNGDDLFDPAAELSRFRFPTLDLLNEGTLKTDHIDEEEQESNKAQIIDALRSYGIEISSISATVGPTITLYEIVPAHGVRIAQIKRLEDDIALTLRAKGIRIIAPIPGKGTVGIEVPNNDPQIVPMRAVLGSKKYYETKAELPMAVGATISNEVYIADLAKMPHLLVAGATGQGKSVGLNAILASLLYKKHPTELKLVLVDPKQLEFSLYSCIERHYLAKLPDEDKAIITDMSKVVPTLNSLCVEMENRYTLLTEAGVRSIKEYNQKFRERRLNPEKGHHFLPYIVVIIDEFADLIMTQGKEVENPISRIAAKARAAGIHMILATQRPSTNIITGVIKANFPGRMAFRVTQMVDSRTIIDRPGANQLIGRGDMLVSRDGVIERVQCAFIDTDEVKAICDFIGQQIGPSEAYLLPEYEAAGSEGGVGSFGSPADRDPLFKDAGYTVIETNTGSTSNLQRKYNIGYPRAGKIMDQLEQAGVVGPTQGGKPRQVLMDYLQFERLLETLELN